jgi:inosine/xanthosine triphosphatase
MKKVIIASSNPVKVNATKDGFTTMYPGEEFIFTGIKLNHDISPQPMSDKETLLGAEKRSKLCQELVEDADYWVGLEGGVEIEGDDLVAFAWIVIRSRERMSKARTGAFNLPPAVAKLVLEGKELGEADDIVFNRQNSKQENGAVGLLTHDIIDRKRYYSHAVILALIPFLNPDHYPAR